MQLTEYLKDIKPVIEENHMYIRIASSDFFSVSKDVVSKMISGEYDAGQAYQSFNSQLLEEETASEDIVLDSQKSYSNRFHSSGGNGGRHDHAKWSFGLQQQDEWGRAERNNQKLCRRL